MVRAQKKSVCPIKIETVLQKLELVAGGIIEKRLNLLLWIEHPVIFLHWQHWGELGGMGREHWQGSNFRSWYLGIPSQRLQFLGAAGILWVGAWRGESDFPAFHQPAYSLCTKPWQLCNWSWLKAVLPKVQNPGCSPGLVLPTLPSKLVTIHHSFLPSPFFSPLQLPSWHSALQDSLPQPLLIVSLWGGGHAFTPLSWLSSPCVCWLSSPVHIFCSDLSFRPGFATASSDWVLLSRAHLFFSGSWEVYLG